MARSQTTSKRSSSASKRKAKPKPFTVEHFRRYASLMVFEDGETHEPEDWQLAFAEDIFAGEAREAWLIVPEGNGKSTFISQLGLYGLDSELWYDEIATLIDSVRPPLGEILTTFPSNNDHKFFSVLAHLSIEAFGDTPYSTPSPNSPWRPQVAKAAGWPSRETSQPKRSGSSPAKDRAHST